MNGVWLKERVTLEQYEKHKKAEFIELRVELTDGSCSDAITFYKIETIKKL